MLCPSYYCLYSLFNKIRDKGKTVSAWKQGGRGKREGAGGKKGGGKGVGGEITQTVYEHMNKQRKNLLVEI
jgi:hypothetical protein